MGAQHTPQAVAGPIPLTEFGQAQRLLARGWTLVLGRRHRVALAPGVPVPACLLNQEEARQ